MRKLIGIFFGVFFRVFLGDTLLFIFAGFWLFLFVAMVFVPGHTVGLYEDNLVILSLEIAICAFAVAWSARRLRNNLRRRNET